MACGDALAEFGVELQIAAKFPEGEIGGLECNHTAFRTHQLSQMKGMRPDVGSDVQNQRGCRDKLAQRGLGATFIDIPQIDRKVYSLRKIEVVGNAAPHDDAPIRLAEQGAAGAKDAVNCAGASDLVDRFQCKIRL